MNEDLVIGIDAGTAGMRAGLFNLRGQPRGFCDQSYPTRYPQPGWAEQQPSDWWRALVQVVRGCLEISKARPEKVIGLAIDAPCNILFTDQNGEPLSASLIWMDLRATAQAQMLSMTGDPVLRYCGGDVPAEWPVPKALWLKQQRFKSWEQAAYLVEQMSWLTHRLTGVLAIPLNSAAAKWHYRTAADADSPTGWPERLLVEVGLEDLPEKVPGQPLAMGAKAGELTRQAAGELGLPAGTAVAMSGIDAHAGMLGLNVLAPGKLALITGTSTCQLAQSARPVFDNGLWGPFQDAVMTGEWTLEAGQASTGGTVRWLLDTLGGALPVGEERYAAADAAASAISPGAEGLVLLDFWQGSRTPIKDPRARGTIWGLTPAHGPGHLLRAVYEGTAYGNRHILEKLNELGVATRQIVACGGGTRSSLWLQVLADVAGLPITLTMVPDAVALGSAICAAVGAGAFTDLRSASQAMVYPGQVVEPNPGVRAIYDEGYARYRATYAALAPLFQQG
ncbi:carbohydrate kinase [Ktedonobacter sp. SOSP1-85]|uniref:FGGY-family carbohydrate kinase n=1 Tax=Ktedonobacter sp. SOSP1-85 TaxID=2778367 RepID=UPI00191547B6|nr:FGGY-family carbohydrate kinase [Ktedonobacter sp. SOSP1-85]GHO77670.1 carbohydrate kinase [Ktedonobacter sp. SOSP1-85]